MAEPTPQDHKNAERRQAIADRFAEQYGRVYSLALGAFGPGWLPSHRHFLIDKADEERCRRTGERPVPAATVYTVRHEETGLDRHFMVRDGQVVEVAGYEEGFGAMLDERHPTMTIEVRGERVHPHRYSLCWSDIPLYEPKTAEQLAALRESRTRKRAEREEKKWTEENPLLAWAETEKARKPEERDR